VSDLMWELAGGAAGRNRATDNEASPDTGRHAVNEEAELTPIFHALTRGGWRSRQHEPAAPSRGPADPVDAFHRDPLTAPIPMQALVAAPTPAWARPAGGAHAIPAARHATTDHGRHHRRRETTTRHC
jgi:hypothetical protein